MAPYPAEGTLVTDKREIAISETWDTQTDWEAFQSVDAVVVENGVVMLEEITIPDENDLHSHFDASDLSSVDPWPNETGESDLTANGGPTLQTGDKNGLNTVLYDGTDDYHTADFNTAVDPPLHVFFVFKIETLSADDFIFSHRGPSGSGDVEFREGDFGGGDWAFAGLDPAGTATTDWYILNGLVDGSNSKYRLNGTQIQTGTSSESADGLTIAELLRDPGRTQHMKAAEYLLYPQNKESIETDVESYLNDKWAVF